VEDGEESKFRGLWQENLKEDNTEDLRIDMRVIKCILKNITTTVQHGTLWISVL
jgi:hypothetical protein